VRFLETPLPGAYVLEPEKAHDDRGFFARVWCAQELAEHGLRATWVQSSISFNEKAGTLRGMHYQAPPHQEVKLVTCTAGAVFDVIIDIRSDSVTFREWFAIELTARNNTTLYVPEGFAHGFLTLEDEAVVEYHMSEDFHPESARGVRWDDPAFGVRWPSEPVVMSSRDREYPDFGTRP
jgi:dTDP-4-dehydrorhamnose 3,5-epimerase